MAEQINMDIGTTAPHVAIIVAIVLFAVYYFLNKYKGKLIGTDEVGVSNFLIQKLVGFIVLGVIPFYYLFQRDDDIPYYLIVNAEILGELVKYIAVIGIIVIGISSVVSSKEKNYKIYPQIRNKQWTIITGVVSVVGWVVYLVGYEFLFRGYLLMSCVKELNVFIAIFINSVLYALAHFDKGRKEIIGSFLIGLVLCMVTFKTGTIWIAIVAHIIIALSNEYFSFKANPAMSFSIFNSKE